jgi:tetratricopeptide (TPR) repeat protein
MKSRSVFPFILLVLQSVLSGQDIAALMRKGDDALASGLWEMAALHFSDCLAHRDLRAEDKSQVAIRLAESWIRDGKPAEALALLNQSLVAQHPEVPFWKGQALAGLGHFSEALAAFKPLLANPAAPHRNETGFTMASLQWALGQPADALATLSTLADTPDDKALTAKAQLHQVEILLDLGRSNDARKTMPATSSIRPGELPLATFLEAHLLLAEDQAAEATVRFQTLVDQPQGQSLFHHHAAAIGLADALLARKSPEAASNFLLSFIQDHPDSPLLQPMFKRLLDGLPDTPTATDPVLERLAQWISPSELTATGAINTLEANAASAWPSTFPSNELLAFSLFTRALGLHRIQTPAARAEARRLLTRLRLEFPAHMLTQRALFQAARWALDEGAVDRAFSMLDTLRESAPSPGMRGEAAFLEARTAFSKGDKDQSIRLFEEAAKSLAENEAQTARFNAAILRLPGSHSPTPVLQTTPAPNNPLAADLELERALSHSDSGTSKSAIKEFLTRHPEHPRVPEARLAAAEAALAEPTADLPFAREQLAVLTEDPEKSIGLSALRIALVRLRISDLAKDSAAAITIAKSILELYPADPAAGEAAFILGRNLFQTRSYNDARLVLQKLAAADTDPDRAQAAGLLAARSAALVPTSQSQQEALSLFDKVIESKGSVASIAMLEKARLMIDLNRLQEASAFLRNWFNSLPKSDPLHLPAGFLLGEAIYAQGSVNPDSLTDALAVYDQLLVHTEKRPSVFNRLQYLRGRTLEQIPDAKDASRKREKQAFIAYYSVLETPPPPAEWHYFELCGFRALALLEKAGRWTAAIACAKKIASFKGPRAEEAATRTRQLQLKHMIWED